MSSRSLHFLLYTRTDTELHKLTDKRGFELTLSLFKNKLATLETILYFHKKQFLREKTDDPAQLKIMIEDALQLVKEVSNEHDRFFLKGTIGNLYRICERPQTALVYLNECLLFAQESGTTTQQIVSLIRVGEALKYNEEHEKASSCLIRRSPSVRCMRLLHTQIFRYSIKANA